MDEGEGGVPTLCPPTLHHLSNKQLPRVGGLLPLVRAARQGLKVGVGVGGWVGKATMLQEGHCKGNQSCTGGRKHGKAQKSEKHCAYLNDLRAIFARMGIVCECERDKHMTMWTLAQI